MSALSGWARPSNLPLVDDPTQTQRLISVTGTGIASAPADVASITVGVSLLGSSVVEATDQAAVLASSIIAAITDAGIPPSDIQTADYSVFAEQDHRSGQPVLRGYRVNNTVRITVRDLANVSHVLQQATNAGGDATTVNGISFTISDDTAVRSSARDAAWANAVAAATQLASLSALTLGQAASISEGSPAPAPQGRMMRRAMVASEAATPIEAGETSVSVTLNVAFEAN